MCVYPPFTSALRHDQIHTEMRLKLTVDWTETNCQRDTSSGAERLYRVALVERRKTKKKQSIFLNNLVTNNFPKQSGHNFMRKAIIKLLFTLEK